MFEIGELMIYGTNGVCRVKDICHSPFDAADERLFYTLSPLNDNTNLIIYSPVDNESVVMRPLISEETAKKLLDDLANIGLVEVPVEKRRRDVYRDVMKTGDPAAYVSIIKTVMHRRNEFRRTRRRLPDLDNDFEHTAKNSLYGELSEVLGKTRDEIHSIFITAVGM
ncbi:MAG: CarD family transcriptional regulator [Clostridia bacterium]|nr:CarD family transcriptional regulator [Clostridia bacterium]